MNLSDSRINPLLTKEKAKINSLLTNRKQLTKRNKSLVHYLRRRKQMIDSLLAKRKQRINCKAKFNTHIKNKKESLKKHSERRPLIHLAFQVEKRLKKTLSTENIFSRKCLLQKQPFLQTSQKRFVSLPKSDAISRTKLAFEKCFCSRFPRRQIQTMFAMNTQ